MESPNATGAKGKCGAQPAARPAETRLDLAEVREKLSRKKGPAFWTSLDELAETPEFQDMLHREFPRHASEWPEGVSRRSFLQLSTASLALAGLTACTRQPVEKIIPYVRKPEEIIPGRPLYFATALSLAGYATGVIVESHEGRPTKVEGNPEHPASLGATDLFAQASVLGLYDPERSQTVLRNGRESTWGTFVTEMGAYQRTNEALGGDGLRFLSGSVTSPSLAAQMADFMGRYPKARWHRWEPAGHLHSREASVRAFGRPLEVRYDLSQADVIVTLDSDILDDSPGSVRYARQFADNRRVRVNNLKMNRLYSVESAPTRTSTLADHRLQLPPAQVEAFGVALAAALGAGPGAPVQLPQNAKDWVDAVAADLRAHAGRSLVVADEYASIDLQVLAHAINGALGNLGTTVLTTEPVEIDPVDHVASLSELVADMNAGRVDMLVMFEGVNPIYTAPTDLEFAKALQKVPFRVHHGLFQDETSEFCQWHVNGTHDLESWSDARAYDGTISIVQPLIEPLYDGKTVHELIALLGGRTDATAYDLIREHWDANLAAYAPALEAKAREAGFPRGGETTSDPAEVIWNRALHNGFLPGSELPLVAVAVNGAALPVAAQAIARAAAQPVPGDGITLLIRPDPNIHDGRFSTNAWLQETAKPITKLSWDNALVFGPKTAERLKIAPEDTLKVNLGVRQITAAAWILPGVAENTAILTLGYGRRRAGKGTGLGFNAYTLRSRANLWQAPGLQIENTGERFLLACTQNHHTLHGGVHEDELASQEAAKRQVVRTGTLAEYQHDAKFILNDRKIAIGIEPHHVAADNTSVEDHLQSKSMYPAHKYDGHAWGMAIDLNVCTGCNVCVIACQSENNIPVVGKEQVLKGREMNWLRIDRYFAGDLDDPEIHHQPLPCMQCENAPCEVVCPVAATVHSDEGLNDMAYNRCVGTRYCSNNCPYKVRRFNFLRFSDRTTPVLALLQNPDVTVRMRGVMEKCTYCVQRIEETKIASKVEGVPIAKDGIKTACQQACPTQAISFGDINQPDWQVSQWKADPLNYGLLEELNTRPRTTYLAKLRNENPNPLLQKKGAAAKAAQGAEHGHA